MAILTWRAGLAGLRVVGLCHSVQGTARLLAEYCEVPPDELTYWVAGINHQAWFLTLEHHGRDLYPRLRSHLDNSETLSLEPVRFELMRRFGYFVTESSGHASEYLPYFRKRPDLRSLFPGRDMADDRRHVRGKRTLAPAIRIGAPLGPPTTRRTHVMHQGMSTAGAYRTVAYTERQPLGSWPRISVRRW
jgi:alpha-galactosidase/6-phospho-beta-glucosidase family protein